VLDADQHLVGIISEANLLQREEIGTAPRHPWWLEAVTPATALAAEFAAAHGKKVDEVMSTKLITCGEDTPLSEVAALLERNRIKRRNVIVTSGRSTSGVSSARQRNARL
jgi:CBS domain-containing protein